MIASNATAQQPVRSAERIWHCTDPRLAARAEVQQHQGSPVTASMVASLLADRLHHTETGSFPQKRPKAGGRRGNALTLVLAAHALALLE